MNRFQYYIEQASDVVERHYNMAFIVEIWQLKVIVINESVDVEMINVINECVCVCVDDKCDR